MLWRNPSEVTIPIENGVDFIMCKFREDLPDMREKVKEYLLELDDEITRCVSLGESMSNVLEFEKIKVRVQVLNEVRNDLLGRLDELV